METNYPRFECGQRVRAAQNLFNDGSYSEQTANAMLVRRGEAGDVVLVARRADTGMVVYLVEFALNQIIGCLDYELMPWCSGAVRNGEKHVYEAHIQPVPARAGLRGYAIA
jgi:nitrogen fixation protein NifZ